MKKTVFLFGFLLILLTSCWLKFFSSPDTSFVIESEKYPGKIEYGLALPWSEAQKYFPRFAMATVIDVETGKSFNIQRRGGTYHADVQPVTAKDTKVLKELYEGEWSWLRRAVIVESGLVRMAGSINGMPHGSGKIKDNDFRGHFCVHFLDSRCHGSRKVDPAHQLMVWKAAGEPQTLFLKAQPQELVTLVIAALNQKDGALASLGILGQEGEEFWFAYQSLLGTFPKLTLEKFVLKEEENPLRRKYQVRISLIEQKTNQKINKEGEIFLIQSPSLGQWFLEGASFKQLLFSED